ncbi:glutamine synthetase family protein [Ruminococcus flavefaciens]|uniref:Glutamine synthetase n=1 Tax=Ruminococcus flavefaciens 007c TaxID=1341157 RepID=W7UR42_RUMFL|nr:glutamine synthetase family protein [Ruminococcus flavefaciens]EWM53939.1 glutamine synthetase [Ruminococcus flavefaciens 007c]
MVYSENEILQYIEENDIKFVKLTFCDLHGRLKNISILSSELAVTFEHGVRIAAKKVSGFEAANGRDLYLFPDAKTMTVLPWRPQQGRVIRMFCFIRYKDGTPFEGDSRYFLKKAMKAAVNAGFCFRFGTSCEFMLFLNDEKGMPTKVPHDFAGYCDTAPDDKGENIRRDVCLTLEQMGIQPVSSRHESGCGQHEIDFNSSSALKAADTFLSFKSAVKSVAEVHGVHASFMPKPLRSDCGNGMHISFTVFPDSDFWEERASECGDIVKSAAAGIMERIREFTLLTNSTVNSYARLGEFTAPREIIWSDEEGSQLIRMSPDSDDTSVELRAADCVCNPYLTLGMMIYSALEGIDSGALLPEKNCGMERLPETLEKAADIAEKSDFLRKYIPENILEVLLRHSREEWREYSSAYDKEAFEDKKYFISL